MGWRITPFSLYWNQSTRNNSSEYIFRIQISLKLPQIGKIASWESFLHFFCSFQKNRSNFVRQKLQMLEIVNFGKISTVLHFFFIFTKLNETLKIFNQSFTVTVRSLSRMLLQTHRNQERTRLQSAIPQVVLYLLTSNISTRFRNKMWLKK